MERLIYNGMTLFISVLTAILCAIIDEWYYPSDTIYYIGIASSFIAVAICIYIILRMYYESVDNYRNNK